MAKETCAASVVVRTLAGGADRKCAIVRLHRLCGPDISYTDLRVAVAGSVDSGKSTLVAVLTHGVGGRPLLDNGHGSARMAVFRHKHEVESGRTSSISQQTLGYDERGVQCIPHQVTTDLQSIYALQSHLCMLLQQRPL